MKGTNNFTVIIPAYDEIRSIADTIAEIQKLPGNFEIIIVDDGSTDGTLECARGMGVTVLRHHTNKGYGAAIKTGVKEAKYETIVITDADKTYPNSRIPELVNVLVNEQLDMVVGARVSANAAIPLLRRPAKWIITKLASFLAGTDIPDLNSGLRVMKKSVIEKFTRILPDGFSFTTSITLSLLTNKYDVKYIPIDYFRRTGKSKIRPLHDTLDFIQLIIKIVLYYDPLKVFLPISLPLIIMGICLILFQVFYYQNITTVSVIIILGGIELLAIGMLADLIDKRLQ